jgi:tellurite resistance protein
MNTKSYPWKEVTLGNSLDQETIRKHLTTMFSDPIFQLLSKKSLFTRIQLESLLLDYITSNPALTGTSPDTKATLRTISKGRSRGSYNRTLAQAKKKLTKMLASVLLAGYSGLIEPTETAEIIEIASELLRLRETSPKGIEEKREELLHDLERKEGQETRERLKKHLEQLTNRYNRSK